jgi:hypothetical protein
MKAEPSLVIEEIIELRTKMGYSTTSLVKHLNDKYGIKTSRAYKLIKEARILLGEVYRKVNEDNIADAIMFMENQKQKAISDGNYKLALDIQKELNKINQLYMEKTEINLIGSIDVTKLFGFDEDLNE